MHNIMFKNPIKAEIIRNGEVIDVPLIFNAVTDEGKNHILDITFDQGTQILNWYLGLIDAAGFTTLDDADTMPSHAGWVELQDYDEVTRPEWDPTVTANQITNAAVREYTINATKTIQGIFVVESATKGGSTGVLWATAEFLSPLALIATDVLRLTYTITVS